MSISAPTVTRQATLDARLRARGLAIPRSGEWNFGRDVRDPELSAPGQCLVGVIPVHDGEDRHVLETAWAGGAEILVTANLIDFISADAEVVRDGRLYRLRRGPALLILAHPFEAVRQLREGAWGAS